MLLVIESIVLCVLFTLAVIPPLYKNPIGQIMSYPTAIRKRVESLPEYKDSILSYFYSVFNRKYVRSVYFRPDIFCNNNKGYRRYDKGI